jgi:Zn-dependent peptidase ImmA (M78 family)
VERPIAATTRSQMINAIFEKTKERILSEISEWMESCGQSLPPIDPLKLVGQRKVYEIRREKLRQHGILIPADDGFMLKLDCRVSRARQRSVLAHELAHTFFYDISSSPPSKVRSLTISAEQEEQWCDEFAGHILMPTKALEKTILEHGPLGMKTFVHVLREFDVSPEFAAWRLTQTDKWPLVIVHLRKRDKERKSENRIRSSWKWRTFKPLSLKKKSLGISAWSAIEAIPSPIECYCKAKDMVVEEEWRFGGRSCVFVVECKHFTGSVPQVIAIFHPVDSEGHRGVLESSALRLPEPAYQLDLS